MHTDGKAKLIAHRCTFDGKRVNLWSDGVISVLNVGRRAIGLDAGWLMLGDVEVYDAAETMRLADCAKRAVRQRYVAPLVYMRRSFAGDRLRFSSRCGSVRIFWWASLKDRTPRRKRCVKCDAAIEAPVLHADDDERCGGCADPE